MNKQSLMKWNLVWVTIYPTRYILHLCPTCLTKDISQIYQFWLSDQCSKEAKCYSFGLHTNRRDFGFQNVMKLTELQFHEMSHNLQHLLKVSIHVYYASLRSKRYTSPILHVPMSLKEHWHLLRKKFLNFTWMMVMCMMLKGSIMLFNKIFSMYQ